MFSNFYFIIDLLKRKREIFLKKREEINRKILNSNGFKKKSSIG